LRLLHQTQAGLRQSTVISLQPCLQPTTAVLCLVGMYVVSAPPCCQVFGGRGLVCGQLVPWVGCTGVCGCCGLSLLVGMLSPAQQVQLVVPIALPACQGMWSPVLFCLAQDGWCWFASATPAAVVRRADAMYRPRLLDQLLQELLSSVFDSHRHLVHLCIPQMMTASHQRVRVVAHHA
jgi:hypothetical protein